MSYHITIQSMTLVFQTYHKTHSAGKGYLSSEIFQRFLDKHLLLSCIIFRQHIAVALVIPWLFSLSHCEADICIFVCKTPSCLGWITMTFGKDVYDFGVPSL